MAAETGFLIDGKVHEVPTLDSLTMRERRIMFELSGVTQEDFVKDAGETPAEYEDRAAKLMRNPGLVEALMHVAYQRGNPDLKREKVQFVIEGTNYLEAVATLVGDEAEEDDEVPLVLTTEPAPPSSNGSVDSETSTTESPGNGGPTSTSVSAAQGNTLTPIGTTRSGTSPTLPQEISAT